MKNDRKRFWQGRTLANLAVVCIGVLLYLGLSNFGAVRAAVGGFLGILQPFVLAVAIAFLLNLPMRFLERHLLSRVRRRRGLAIVLTYVLALALLALLVGLIVPQLIDSVRTLVLNISVYLGNLNDLVSWAGGMLELDPESIDSFMLSYNDLVGSIVRYIRELLANLPDVLPNVLSFTMQVGSGIVGALTAVIASIYMLASKEKLLRQCRRVAYALLKPARADALMRVGRKANGVFSGFIGGKIIDSAIIGLICFVFMSLMNLGPVKMPFALLISVIIGVTNIIPFFGPFIGAIPSIMILLMVNPWSAIWFTVFIIVLQQFDGNVLGPKILGDTTGLPAMWVLVSIVVFGGLFGFLGMVIGVPTTAVLYSLAGDFIEARLKKRGLEKDQRLEPPPPAQGPAPPPGGGMGRVLALGKRRKAGRGGAGAKAGAPPTEDAAPAEPPAQGAPGQEAPPE